MSVPAEPPAEGLDDRAKQELRRYLRRSMVCVAVGLAVFVGFVIAATLVERGAEELERTGARVPGVVIQLRSPGERGSILVEFAWEGQLRRERVQLDAESPRYRQNQSVTVLVDRNNPDRVSLVGETNQSELTVLPMVSALVGGVGDDGHRIVGVGASQTSTSSPAPIILASCPMSVCRDQQWAVGARGHPPTRSRRQRADLDARLDVRWRLGKSGLREATSVEVAGDSTGYVILRAPGGGPLLSARPPATRRAAKRWRRAIVSE